MFQDMDIANLLLLLSPLILIELGLKVFCLVKIFRQGVANLNKWAWVLIVLFVQTFGSIAFLFFGRRRDVG